MTIRIFYCFFLVLLVQGSTAQTTETRINEYVKALVANQHFTGNILIVDKDRIVYSGSHGYANFEQQVPNTLQTSFPIASISKLFTAIAIMQLQEKGKLDVKNRVADYLPGFPYPEIHLTHLLSHTSGLPPYNAFFDSVKEKQPQRIFYNKDFLAGLQSNKKPLLYAPGDRGNYDNINYIVLALIIEKLSGKPYEKYVGENVLHRAGMKNTRYFPLPDQYNASSIPNFAYPRVALHYYDTLAVRANTIPYIKSYWKTYAFKGFGDYVSTLEDLRRFAQAVDQSKLLKQSTLDKMYEVQKLNNGSNNPAGFGLGWVIGSDTSYGRTAFHPGGATGLSCTLIRNLSNQQVVIIFDNAHSNAHSTGVRLMQILNGKIVPIPKISLAKAYGRVLSNSGLAAARDTLQRLLADTLNYSLDEEELNLVGYDFMGTDNPFHLPVQHRYDLAVEAFRTNMELFPKSWNVYDSYGEALLATGRKEEAIRMYKKSMELNPQNENGRRVLESMGVK